MKLDGVDRALINHLQDDLPLVERPFAEVAATLGLTEDLVLERVRILVANGVLSRFGPLFDAERMGGGLALAAIEVPDERFVAVAEQVNAFPEVAHNYARKHRLNMWLVIATEEPARVGEVAALIERATGLRVLLFPKLAEYALSVRFEA